MDAIFPVFPRSSMLVDIESSCSHGNPEGFLLVVVHNISNWNYPSLDTYVYGYPWG